MTPSLTLMKNEAPDEEILTGRGVLRTASHFLQSLSETSDVVKT